MLEIQKNVDHTLSSFEKGLNIAGYVPIISSFSGPLRIGYGKVEVIGAVAFAAILALRAFSLTGLEQEELLNKAVEMLSYTLHGIANIFRGAIETIPLISLFTCLPYDLMFQQRFTYPTEIKTLFFRDSLTV